MRRFIDIPLAFNGLRVSELNVYLSNAPVGETGLLGYADLTLNDAIKIREIRVVKFAARRGLHFRKFRGGLQDRESTFPVTDAARTWLEKIVLAAYDRTVADLRAEEAIRRWSRASECSEHAFSPTLSLAGRPSA